MGTAIFLVYILGFGALVSANPLESKRDDLGVLKADGKNGSIILPTTEIDGFSYYSPNTDAHWKFECQQGEYVMITSEYFDLEVSDDCVFDSLTVDEGGSGTKFCGTGPFVYISHDNKLDLYFYSDVTHEGRGFKMEYDIKLKADIPVGHCNSSIIGGADGELFSSKEVCYFSVQANPGEFVNLNLKSVAFGSRTCTEESIRIYHGASNHGKLLKEICSDVVNGPIQVSEEKLFIEYRRTFEIEGEDERFIIEYTLGANALTTTLAPVTTPSAVGGDNDCSGFFADRLKSFPYEVPHYENNRECILVVRNTHLSNHVIQVTFEDFDLEEIDQCSFDSVKVISGERTDSQSLGGPYCGNSLKGKTFLTYGNSLRLEFKTDESFAFYGFKANIGFVPRSACICEDDNKVCVRTGFEKKCLTGNKCGHRKCQNGGTCVETRTSEQCYCREGFSGDDCSVREGKAGYVHFKKIPINRVIIQDDSLLETCLAELGQGQTASYAWTLHGQMIAPYSQKAGFGVLADGYLKIDHFSADLEGEYTCTATVDDVPAEIYFEYKLVEHCQAVIEVKPEDQVRNIGDLVTLSCLTSGASRVLWRKDNKELEIEKLDRFDILPTTSILKITNVSESDQGQYTCVAVDANGCSTKRSARLTVTQIERHNEYCGLTIHNTRGKVSQGSEVRLGDHPWQVTMINANSKFPFCGASVISQKFILTAAHCITNLFENLENVKLLFGGTNCKGEDARYIRYPKRIIKHPSYGEEAKYNNDIALIELNEDIHYGRYIRPICLQRESFYKFQFFEKRTQFSLSSGQVAGCGEGKKQHGVAPNAMMFVNLPYVSQEKCMDKYEGETEITKNMFCAGFEQNFKGDVCSGDSGGAYVMTDENRYYQTGIVSQGKGCDNEYYTIFTHVGNYYDWIKGESQFDKEKVVNFIN